MASKVTMNYSSKNGAFSATSVNVDKTVIEAGDTIIGGLLLDKAAINWMYDILNLRDLLLRRHKFIVQAIKNFHTSNKTDSGRCNNDG